MSMELLEAQDDKKSEGPSFIVFLIVCLVISLAAGGAGFGVSATMLKPVTMAPAAATPEAAAAPEGEAAAPAEGHGAATAHGEPAKRGEAALPEDLSVIDISPITTNLLDPAETWIRMELSLAFEGESDPALAEEIQQDILAYVHTMRLYNLRGGSGFQHLMEDLNDRASIRSEGRVKRVLVRSFILE